VLVVPDQVGRRKRLPLVRELGVALAAAVLRQDGGRGGASGGGSAGADAVVEAVA